MTVTVLLITYNHERFIARAIDSVLMQRAPFEFELVVMEDCSTDRTREIVIEYQRRHPGKIRAILAARNQRSTRPWTRQVVSAAGRYIALLDGDDYWTDPEKLQKQVAFLDSHPECAMCYHNVTLIHDAGFEKARPRYLVPQPPISTLDDLLAGNFVCSCSVMFRAGLVNPFPKWFEKMFVSADWTLFVLLAQHGRIGYLDEIMAAYRQHARGIWSQLSEIRQTLRVLDFYQRLGMRLELSGNASYRHALRQRGGELLVRLRAAARACKWSDVLLGAAGVLRFYPQHLLTELAPRFQPLEYRRYPLLARLAVACRRKVPRFRVQTQAVSFEGFVDQVDHTKMTGWAWNSCLPNDPIDVEVWERGTPLIRISADLFRHDLLVAGKGNGYHAFVVQLPPSFRDGRPHAVEMRVVHGGTTVMLTGTPVEVMAPSAA